MERKQLKLNKRDERFRGLLEARGVCDEKIVDVLESGYTLGMVPGTISDQMYGNKMFSSCFGIHEFVEYVKGKHEFQKLPGFVEYVAKI